MIEICNLASLVTLVENFHYKTETSALAHYRKYFYLFKGIFMVSLDIFSTAIFGISGTLILSAYHAKSMGCTIAAKISHQEHSHFVTRELYMDACTWNVIVKNTLRMSNN